MHKQAERANPIIQLTVFLAIAFLLPLFCMNAIMGWPFFQTGAPNLVLYGVEAMAPTLAALICVSVFSGRVGLRRFLKKSYAENVSAKTIALAAIIPLAVFFGARILSIPFTGAAFEVENMLPAQWLAVSWALVAEELGWRGYFQDHISLLLKPMLIPLVTGLVWAAWHYHFFIYLIIDVPIPLFVLGCVSESYVYYALTVNSRGNIIPASVFHFAGNMAINIFTVYPYKNNGSSVPYIVGIILMSAVALVMNARMRRVSYEQSA